MKKRFLISVGFVLYMTWLTLLILSNLLAESKFHPCSTYSNHKAKKLK